ncbi:MAG: hypothetical protein MZW92_24305 [Comamonadaceae bacterium]|nr:hypothetical protein [Comamonadaceae bacterium]
MHRRDRRAGQGDDHPATRSAGRSTRSARRTSAPMAMIQLLLGNMGMAGRRRQRAARPLQHPGAHRPGACSPTCCRAT